MILSLLWRAVVYATKPWRGVRRRQAFWQRVEQLALEGQNVGLGGDVESSGEIGFLKLFLRSTRIAQDPAVVFDVGANTGTWSARLLELARAEDRIIHVTAFEPSAAAREQLARSAASGEGLTVEPVALGREPGRGILYANAAASSLASLHHRRLDHFGIKMELEETVEVTTLDRYCRERGVDRIDLLKLDVEGAELDVLWGSTELLEGGRIGALQFEFGGCNIDSRTFFQDFWYLLHERFELYRVVSDGLWPIERYREQLERFVTTNYVAISRSNDVLLEVVEGHRQGAGAGPA